MSRKKRQHEEEHENHERWLVSYADFITLLFAFFVVMYSVSRVDNKRLAQATNAIRWALHHSGTGGNNSLPLFDGPTSEQRPSVLAGPPPPAKMNSLEEIEKLRRRIETRLQPFLMKQVAPTAVTVKVEGGRRITVRLAAAQFFDPGQAALRPQILPVLDAIADEIVPIRKPLRVEGHTDDSPVQGSRFRNNWELSAARAATVADYLEQAHHAEAQLLSAVGLASTHPIATGDTPEAREANRRVELVVEVASVDGLSQP